MLRSTHKHRFNRLTGAPPDARFVKPMKRLTMRPTHSALSKNTRKWAVELSNRRLAAVVDRRGQLKQAHWNVRGPNSGAADLFPDVSRGIDHRAAK
jgi:hypothetical protein